MTIKTIYKTRTMKVCYDSEWQEYYVNAINCAASAIADHPETYFTEDKEDAIKTCDYLEATHVK